MFTADVDSPCCGHRSTELQAISKGGPRKGIFFCGHCGPIPLLAEDTMKPIWLFESDIFDEGNPEQMAVIASKLGMAVKFVGHRPMDGGMLDRETRHVYPYDKVEKLCPPQSCVVAYGSIQLISNLVKSAPWYPTAWMDLAALKCSSYYAHWGHWCLQREYAMMPWADVARVKDHLYDSLGSDGCLFFRPDANTKTFNGQVVHRDEFQKWFDREEYCYSPAPESMVIVAKPWALSAEWRVVMVDRKPITASLYKRNGRTLLKDQMEEGAPDEVIKLAETLGAHPWQPQRAYVLDVCLSGDEYRLLEIGDCNAAGLYKCDLEKVVTSLSALAEKEWEEVYG